MDYLKQEVRNGGDENLKNIAGFAVLIAIMVLAALGLGLSEPNQ